MRVWESQREWVRRWSRREPELTPLYRIVSSAHGELELCWEDLFQTRYGVLRDEARESFERYLSCGILKHGCARAECQNRECRHSELIAFSCKCRCLCPSCSAKRATLFAENLVEKVLLPYPQQHCVFSIPKRVRPFFKFNRELLQHLYRAGWESWKELVLETCPSGTPGGVLALHRLCPTKCVFSLWISPVVVAEEGGTGEGESTGVDNSSPVL